MGSEEKDCQKGPSELRGVSISGSKELRVREGNVTNPETAVTSEAQHHPRASYCLLSQRTPRHCPRKTGYLPTSSHKQVRQIHKLVTRQQGSEKKKKDVAGQI